MTNLLADRDSSARGAAYQCLFEVLIKGAYTNISISRMLRSTEMNGADKRLLTEIVYGVCRRYNYLVWIIRQLSTRRYNKIHPAVRILVCMGLYQIIFMDSVPDSAAVNETVAIAKQVTHIGNTRFVNGMLRSYIRKKETLSLSESLANPEEFLALTYNQPSWLIELFTKQYGKEKTRDILRDFNVPGSIFFRVNHHKASDHQAEELLTKHSVEFEAVQPSIGAYRLCQGMSPVIWQLLDEGIIYIQNIASMVPAVVLAPQPGDSVLDMCAAPGSKTTQMADLMKNTGHIAAWDLYPHKLKLINQNAERMGFTCIQAECRDALAEDFSFTERFDRILVDAPCSGLGVLGHKPELRWKRSNDELRTFPKTQLQLLERAASYLKSDGTLVYSTCTLNRDENDGVIAKFLSSHPEFILQPFSFDSLDADCGMLTLFPDAQGRDGFFVAKLARRQV